MGKAGDGISQIGVRASERLDGDVDGTSHAVGTVARMGCFQGGEGTRVEAFVGEDLTEVGLSVEVDNVFLRKFWG